MKKYIKFFALTIAAFVAVTVVYGAVSHNSQKQMHLMASSQFAMVGAIGAAQRKANIFNALRNEFPDNPVIAPSFIRMEAYLVNGKAEYEFFHRLLGNEAATERKLNEQDAFRITDVGIFLMQESTTVPGIGLLSTYPNPQQFPDEAGFVENKHLEHIYNGFIKLKVGDTIYVPDMPVLDARVVNTAQQTALATNDSERHPGDGFIPTTPQYTIYGRETNEIKLAVPASSTHKIESQSGTSGFKHKVVCILLGYKITGGSNKLLRK